MLNEILKCILFGTLLMSIPTYAQTSSQSDENMFKIAISVAETSGEKANQMGMQYIDGSKLCTKDISKAIQLFEIGATKFNYNYCYFNLAAIYGPESEYENLPKSIINFKKCVELFPTTSDEYSISLYNLGFIYQNGGKNLSPDFSNAIYWYEKSYASGDYNAALRLAYIYARGGNGVAQDKQKFKAYAMKAAESGDKEATLLRNFINDYGIDAAINVILENNYH